jgi:CDGSH-type Zn-finger protein
MNNAKPKIACLPNGPYYLLNDLTPQTIPNIQKAKSDPCATVTGAALCRCGGSSNKPFCAGTHGTNGCRDAKRTDGKIDKRANYVGQSIMIYDNRGICSHAGYCTDNLKSVFRLGEEPWIDPDGATAQEIIDTIKQCPSGALSHTVDDIEYRDQDRPPMVTVTKDGPYVVTDGIELVERAQGEGTSPEHYALCRCGGSKNKPFCDGTHWHIGFSDDKTWERCRRLQLALSRVPGTHPSRSNRRAVTTGHR